VSHHYGQPPTGPLHGQPPYPQQQPPQYHGQPYPPQPHYGPPPGHQPLPVPGPTSRNWVGVVSLVLGLLGLVLLVGPSATDSPAGLAPWGLLAGLVGLCFGAAGRSHVKVDQANNLIMCRAGMICGALAAAAGIAIIVIARS
jgi:hypothetical protein